MDMIILILPQALNVITAIINKSIETSKFPTLWKKALVTAIPKITSPITLKDLRPISILPFLSKILERVVHTQLSLYLESNGILPELQSGFRKKRGTVTALLDVTDNILTNQDEGRGTILTLLDFSRAFDCLNIPMLLSKLSYYGVNVESLAWFNSYLSGRSQVVQVVKEDGSRVASASLPVNRGVPQGSILGPLLFIIYTADIATQIANCQFHLYADDVQVYVSFFPKEFSDAVHKMNEDLARISNWTEKNALMLNASKSKYMVLGSKKQIAKIKAAQPNICILNERIDPVVEARNLGIVIDGQLRFETHILNLVKNCFYRIKLLYKIRNLLSEDVRIALCESLVLSKLNYGDVLYGPRLLSTSKRLIQRVQNACSRFCFNVPPRSHITPFLNKAGLLNMSARRELHLTTLVYDLILFERPSYLYKKLVWSSSHNAYKTRASSYLLTTKKHKTTAFRGSFRYQATKCWNNIPPPLRKPMSKGTFRQNLKAILLTEQKLPW